MVCPYIVKDPISAALVVFPLICISILFTQFSANDCDLISANPTFIETYNNKSEECLTLHDRQQVLWPMPMHHELETNNVTVLYFNLDGKTGKLDLDHFVQFKNRSLKENKALVERSASRIFKVLETPQYKERYTVFRENPSNYLYQSAKQFSIFVTGSGEYPLHPTHEDESYTVEITKDGLITIHADTTLGAIYGINTLEQLIQCNRPNPETNIYSECYIPNAPLLIKDRPHFLHRSVMIDVARHFIPTPKLKEVVELMSNVKLNALHLHLTDNHAWPIEIEEYKYLSRYASFQNKTYTREDIRDLVDYAKVRGIRIIPEIPAPGRAPKAMVSPMIYGHYGYLGKCMSMYFNTPEYTSSPPAGQWKIEEERTAEVLKYIWSQMAEDFSTAPFLHIGGEAININCTAFGSDYQNDEPELKEQYTRENYLKFMGEIHHHVADSLDQRAGLWADSLAKYSYDIANPRETYLHLDSFDPEHSEELDDFCAKGGKLIMATSELYSLGCGQGQWFANKDTDCRYDSWKAIYSKQLKDVYEDLPLFCKGNIYGASLNLWTEQITENNLLSQLFPRAFAFAERMWSDPLKLPADSEDKALWIDAQKRLRLLNDQNMQDRCLNVGSIQPAFCSQEPQFCDQFSDYLVGAN